MSPCWLHEPCYLGKPSLVQIIACCLLSARPYLNQCCHIVNYTHRNNLQWNFNRNFSIHENAFEIVVWNMAAVLLQCDLQEQMAIDITRSSIPQYYITAQQRIGSLWTCKQLDRSLKWCHNDHHCLSSPFHEADIKENTKEYVTGPFVREIHRCPVNSPIRGSNAESVSMERCHHVCRIIGSYFGYHDKSLCNK